MTSTGSNLNAGSSVTSFASVKTSRTQNTFPNTITQHGSFSQQKQSAITTTDNGSILPALRPSIAGNQPATSDNKQPLNTHERDMLYELQDTINILQLKISKLEQLLALKDQKISDLSHKLNMRAWIDVCMRMIDYLSNKIKRANLSSLNSSLKWKLCDILVLILIEHEILSLRKPRYLNLINSSIPPFFNNIIIKLKAYL